MDCFGAGKGRFKRARIFIPFHVADAPAHASIAMCYSNAACTYCTYHPRGGQPYSSRVHRPRDVELVKKYTEQAERYLLRRAESRTSGAKKL
jgi:hypothetical protein